MELICTETVVKREEEAWLIKNRKRKENIERFTEPYDNALVNNNVGLDFPARVIVK